MKPTWAARRPDVVASSYLVSLAQSGVGTSRTQAIEQFSEDPAAKKYLDLAVALGRPPIPSEFASYPDLLERVGSLGRIERLARQVLSVDAVNETRRRRKEDILTYIAMMRLLPVFGGSRAFGVSASASVTG